MHITFLTQNQELIDEVNRFILCWNDDTTFFETQTSGSTGNAKTIQITKSVAMASAKLTGKALSLEKGQNALLALSPSTIGGKMMIVRSIVLDLNLFVEDVSRNPLKEMVNEIDFIALAPIQIEEILNHTPNKLSSISTIIVGGAPLSETLNNRLKELQINAYQTFGMTETVSHVALKKIGANQTDYYQGLPGVTFAIGNEDNLLISSEELGINNLETNDVVDLLDNHRFKWIGRKDFIINSGGVKINPEIVEQELSSKILQPFFICGVKDEVLGEKVVLVIESEQETFLKKKDFLFLSNKYASPKEIWLISSFIRTESAKINRRLTLEKAKDAAFRKIL